jgi:two-component system, OmpR family, response regulator ChvI
MAREELVLASSSYMLINYDLFMTSKLYNEQNGSSNSNNIRILIVDDEEDITLFLRKALEKANFDVTSFNDPVQALSNFKPGNFELALLDIKMPKMDGFELYQRIQKIDVGIKVCFMTAFEIYTEALKEIFPDSYSSICFIKKPFSVDDFIKRITKETSREPPL